MGRKTGDQSTANDELARIAKQKNIFLPMDLSDKKQKTMIDFAAKKSRDFEKAYASSVLLNWVAMVCWFEVG
ncbi:DUF4142 domain-containing protein [Dyadobacter sp. MSC1_007]|uniref:DUF4142 domain-containing protein n=1 Tax=Dyadobacter sp. MSC1_007 TaxID=2909264 RepID=UPI0038D474A7